MKRRYFLGKGIIAGAMLPTAYSAFPSEASQAKGGYSLPENNDDIIIEKPLEGRPHEGKILAAIQPHCDDIALFAGGTVAKLISEGYTGYMIRASNDDATGRGSTVGEQVRNNEISNDAVARALGLKKVYNLGYRNHRMEEYNIQEMKGRLILLFRMLKVDTVVCYDPWSTYEENPDHYVTARAVEAACWQAGSHDYPEQLELVQPHLVREKYYFARGPQLVNRVVDIGKYIDKKAECNALVKSQGPTVDTGARLRNSLAAQGKRLPILGDDDETANLRYAKHFVLDIDSQSLRGVPSDKKIGEKYGLEWAEQFHYIGPYVSNTADYLKKNVVPK